MNNNRKQRLPTPTAVLCELAKLRSQQQHLELGHNGSHKHLPPDFHFTRTEANRRFDEYRNTKWADVQNISDSIRHFRQTMLSEYGLQSHETNEYRDEILRIDKMLKDVSLKNSAELVALCSQKILNTNPEQEAVKIAKLLCKPSSYKRQSGSPSIVGIRRYACVDRKSNIEVKRFFDYLARHNGHSGGWPDEEHLWYVRIKSKYGKNVQRIVESLQELKGIERSEEEIVSHDKWYDKYLELKQKYREAIRDWKAECNNQPKRIINK